MEFYMKKTLYFAFFALMLFVISGFASPNMLTYADLPEEVTIENLDISLYATMGDYDPLPNENNEYSLDFQNFDENNTITTANNPYGTYYIGVTLDCQPSYDGLSDDAKFQIFNDVRNNIYINGNKVEFTNNEVINENNYIIYCPDRSDYYINTKIFIRITPIKAGITIISCDVYNTSANLTLNCKYATPSTLSLEYDTNLTNQLYENFQPITFTAVPNYQNWLDQNTPFHFEWAINSEIVSEISSNSFTLTKNLIQIGNYIITVSINDTILQASAEIHVNTEEGYIVTIDITGELEFVHGEYRQPIQFTASIPVQETYTVDWFMKAPDNSIFNYQSTSPSYEFISTQYSIGDYKVFAVVRYNGNNYYSQVSTIRVKPVELEGNVNITLNVSEYQNEYTGLTAYEFSIDAKNYFKNEDIIWFVSIQDDSSIGVVRRQIGYTFNFQPTRAENYLVSVYSLEGSQLNPLASQEVTPRRIGQNYVFWIYLLSITGAIIILGVVSIIISNKAREKIW